jgi:hypothetical protein
LETSSKDLEDVTTQVVGKEVNLEQLARWMMKNSMPAQGA